MIEISGRRFINIADDVTLGRDGTIFEFVNLYGCIIGDETRIGTSVDIQRDVLRRAGHSNVVRIARNPFVLSVTRLRAASEKIRGCTIPVATTR